MSTFRAFAITLSLAFTFFFQVTVAQPPVLYTETHLSEPASAPREHNFRQEQMKVEVSFDCPKGIVHGKVTHYIMPLADKVDSIYLDAVKMTIKNVEVNGKAVKFEASPDNVILHPNPALVAGTHDSITIVYDCAPRRGLFFIGWNDPKNLSRKQIWSQGEGTDNRNWIPMYDDWNNKCITETVVTFDSAYQVLSNGTKLSVKDNGDGTKTWHYKMTHRHSPYLIMLGIGKYAIEDRKTKSGVPVHLWYYPEHPEYLSPTYVDATECIDFVANWTGIPYPWESYSQIPVQDFIYGAMENTTATIYGDFFLTDKRGFLDRGYLGVDVHELTHQWFGDLITIRVGEHMWLHESYATFFPKLFTRDYFGQDPYEWGRRGEQNGLIAANDIDRYPVVHPKNGTARVYGGGSAILDMMLYTFGEDAMKRVIHHYLSHHMYSNVETNDLYQSFQDTLGISPDWFFDEWLYRGGYPVYDVSYQDVSRQGVTGSSSTETQITVSQTHHTDELTKLFKMPIVFEVHYSDGTKSSTRQWIEKQTQTVSVPNPGNKKVAFVLFDPGSNIVKKVNFKKSFDELKAQALGAEHVNDRYDAIIALKSDSSSASAKRDLLVELYHRNKFGGIRSEILSQLAGDESPDARNIMRRGILDSLIEVRNATLAAFRFIPKDLEPDFEKLLKDSSYTMIVNALDKMCESFPENKAKYLDMTKDEDGPSHKCRIKWLEIKAGMGDKDALAQLDEYCSISYEFITRQNAMQVLQRLSHLDQEGMVNMIDAYLSPNNRLAGTAYGILNGFYQQTASRDMMMTYYKSKPWEPWQKEILQNVIK